MHVNNFVNRVANKCLQKQIKYYCVNVLHFIFLLIYRFYSQITSFCNFFLNRYTKMVTNKILILLLVVLVFAYALLADCINEHDEQEFFNDLATANTYKTLKSDSVDGDKLIPDWINFGKNLCDMNCCTNQSPIYWNPKGNIEGQKYQKSQYTCMDQQQNAGCMCMTKDQHDFLARRGQNNNYSWVNKQTDIEYQLYQNQIQDQFQEQNQYQDQDQNEDENKNESKEQNKNENSD